MLQYPQVGRSGKTAPSRKVNDIVKYKVNVGGENEGAGENESKQDPSRHHVSYKAKVVIDCKLFSPLSNVSERGSEMFRIPEHARRFLTILGWLRLKSSYKLRNLRLPLAQGSC